MMTVNRYADLVNEILEAKYDDVWLEDHEVEWVVDCFNLGFPPSLCAGALEDWQQFYQETMQEDEQLRRAA